MLDKLKEKFNFLSNQLARIVILLVILYIIFNIGKSINNNYQINQKIAKLNQEIAELESDNRQAENINLYYQTDAYKEIEARRQLGLKKPDEKVVIIPENSSDSSAVDDYIKNNQSEEDNSLPNYRKWWNYVLGE